MVSDFSPEILLDMTVRGKLRNYNGMGLNKDKEAVVYYDVPLGAGSECIEWLRENRKTIVDVEIDHQNLDGLWRSVMIQSEQSTTNKQSVTIVQTFRFGFIQSLVADGEIIWGDSRLTTANMRREAETDGAYPAVGDTTNNPQQYYLIEWQGVDPEKVDEIVKSIHALTPSGISPVVNGESLGSNFYILNVVSEIEQRFNEQDKAAIVRVLVGKPRFNLQTWESFGTPASAKIYYLFDVPVYIAQTIINMYNQREGATASATAPNEQGLVSITIRDSADEYTDDKVVTERKCSEWVLTQYYYGLSEPINVDLDNPVMGITYRARFDLVRQEGKYFGFIEKSVRQTQKITYPSVNTHGESVVTTEYTGLYKDGSNFKEATLSLEPATIDGVLNPDAGDIKITLGSAITLPQTNLSDGDTWQMRQSVNDDCTVNITIQESESKSVSNINYDAADNNAAKTTATEKVNRSSGEIVLNAGANESLRANVRYNKNTGLFDITEEKTESKTTEGSEETENLFSKRATERERNTDTIPAFPARVAGKIRRLSVDETEFAGRYNVEQTEDEAIAVSNAGGASTETTFETQTSTSSRNAIAEPTITTAESGKVKQLRKTLNEFERWDSESTEREAIQVTDAQKEITRGIFEDVESDTVRNKAGAARIATQTDGEIQTVRVEKTEFPDTVNDTLSRRIFKAVAGFLKGYRDTASIYEETTGDRNIEEPLSLVAVDTASGTITEVRSEKNQAGRWDRQTVSRMAKNQTATRAVDAGDESVSETRNTQGDTSLPSPVGGVGTIAEASSTPTDFGKWDNVSRTRTAKPQSVTHESEDRSDQSTQRVWEKNAAVQVDAVAEIGTIVRANSTQNSFGLYDNEKQTITAKNQASTDYSEDHLSLSEVIKNTQAETELADVEAADGERISVRNDETPFGKFATVKQTETAIEITAKDYQKTGTSSLVVDKTYNGDEVTASPTRLTGTVVSVSQTPTPYKNKWNITEATETGEPWDTGWITVPNYSGQKKVRRWGNQQESFGANVAASFTPYWLNSFGHSRNRYGLYDGEATQQSPDGIDDGKLWKSTTTKTSAPFMKRDPYGEVISVNFVEKSSISTTVLGAEDRVEQYLGDIPSNAFNISKGIRQVTYFKNVGFRGYVTWFVPA